jgi:hypothetical protein
MNDAVMIAKHIKFSSSALLPLPFNKSLLARMQPNCILLSENMNKKVSENKKKRKRRKRVRLFQSHLLYPHLGQVKQPSLATIALLHSGHLTSSLADMV